MRQDSQLKKLQRWLNLLTILQGGWRPTAQGLAERFGVSPRTIWRDIDELERAGVPIVRDGGQYTIMEGYQLRPVQLSSLEIGLMVAVLEYARRHQKQVLRTNFGLGLYEKLTAVMPKSNQQQVARFASRVVVDPQPASSGPPLPGVSDAIHKAIDEHRRLSLQHRPLTRDKPIERIVHPYGLVNRGPGWYLIAFCELRQEMRFFRVNRITEAKVLASSFNPPLDFELRRFVAEHWGIEHGPLMQVRVRFVKAVAPLVTETLWHPSQELQPQTDGSVILSMTVRGTNEIARWLAGFGNQAEVLEPVELRQTVINLGKGIVEQYLTKNL